MMKVNDFISKLVEVEKKPTIYKLGTFMNKKQGKHILCDCSGLIKGILWGYPSKGKYGSNGVPDINANTMISRCKDIKSDMSKIDIGEVVWLNGHIGVYIGDGKVIESSPRWENGIQVTKLKDRKWLRHGHLPYIDYTDGVGSIPKTEPTNLDAIVDKVINGDYGNGTQRKLRLEKDGFDYKVIQALVNKKLKG